MSSRRTSPSWPLLFEAMDELAQTAPAGGSLEPVVAVDQQAEVDDLVRAMALQCAAEGVTHPLVRLEEVARRLVTRAPARPETAIEPTDKKEPPYSSRLGPWPAGAAAVLTLGASVVSALCGDLGWMLLAQAVTVILLAEVCESYMWMRSHLKPSVPRGSPPKPSLQAVSTSGSFSATVLSSPISTARSQVRFTIISSPGYLSQDRGRSVHQAKGPSNFRR